MSLIEALARAEQHVLTDEMHDLPIAFRRTIWEALGPRCDTGWSAGKEKRYALARRCVEKALPVWEGAFPGNLTPSELLEIAEGVRTGMTTPRVASEARGTYWRRLDNLCALRQDAIMAVSAGYGAAQVIALALWDELFNGPEWDEQDDAGLDAEQLDPAFMACTAYAGGTIWDPEGDPMKRKEFWLWWIEQAKDIGAARVRNH